MPSLKYTFATPYFTIIFLIMARDSLATTFTLINKCHYTVWPGILSNSGSPNLDSTGFELQPGSTHSLQTAPKWSGRLWARTGCSTDPSTGSFRCQTGDCGSSQIECNGSGASPPATLAEFTIDSSDGSSDFYDVSLVDGYNLPMVVEPMGGSGVCGSTGCAADVNRFCPNELRAGDGQACMSACGAFGRADYCCSGEFGSPDKCGPSVYSEMFKNACPRAYSYAFDDATSTFTCIGSDYTITFCPSMTSQKSSRDSPISGASEESPPTSSSSSSSSSSSNDSDSHPHDDLLPWLPNFYISKGSSAMKELKPNVYFIYGLVMTILFSFFIC